MSDKRYKPCGAEACCFCDDKQQHEQLQQQNAESQEREKILLNAYKQQSLMLANIQCDYNDAESCRKLILSLRQRGQKAIEKLEEK